jgi:hypothetical protein
LLHYKMCHAICHFFTLVSAYQRGTIQVFRTVPSSKCLVQSLPLRLCLEIQLSLSFTCFRTAAVTGQLYCSREPQFGNSCCRIFCLALSADGRRRRQK